MIFFSSKTFYLWKTDSKGTHSLLRQNLKHLKFLFFLFFSIPKFEENLPNFLFKYQKKYTYSELFLFAQPLNERKYILKEKKKDNTKYLLIALIMALKWALLFKKLLQEKIWAIFTLAGVLCRNAENKIHKVNSNWGCLHS